MRRAGLPDELRPRRARESGAVSVADDPGAVLACDVRRRVTDVSPAALSMLERPRAEVVGRALEDLAPANARLRAVALLTGLVREQPGSWRTVGLASGLGQPIPLELACRPLDGSGGHLFALRRPSGGGAARPALKEREREVFARIAEGKTGAEIADEMYLSPASVERHVASALRSLGAKNRAHGIAMVLRSGELESLVAGASEDWASEEAGLGSLLKQTLERLEDPAAVLGGDGDVLFVNDAWRAFGRTNGQSGVQHEDDYLAVCGGAVGSDEALQAALGIRELLDGHSDSFSMEYRCDAPDGPRWFDLRAARYAGDDTVAKVLVRHHDLTELRRAEGDARLGTSMLDGVEAATLAFSPEGEVIAWMASAETTFGWRAADAIGRPIWELTLARRDRSRGEAVVEEIRRNGRWSGEMQLEQRDGSVFPGHVRARALHDGAGTVTQIVSVVVDVSEQRRTLREATDARAQLHALAGTMREGWISGDATGTIEHVNAAACELLGWKTEDLVGSCIDEITCIPTPFRHLPRRSTEDGSRVIHEECVLSSDGREVPIEYTTSRFSTGDVLERWVIVFRVLADS